MGLEIKCAKCGGERLDIEYHRYFSPFHNCKIYSDCIGFDINDEHLHYTCTCCGYEFPGKCLDKEKG